MFNHTKIQLGNSEMPESSFTIDQIMHLHINFLKLVLMQGSSYIQLPKWITLE